MCHIDRSENPGAVKDVIYRRVEKKTDRKKIVVQMFSEFKAAATGRDKNDVDSEALYKLFKNELGVPAQNIYRSRGRKREEVREILNQGKREKFQSCDLIFLIFLVHKDKGHGELLKFYNGSMSLFDIFDIMKDIKTPKVFLIQSDDEKLVPTSVKSVPVPSKPDQWDPGKLPQNSVLLMSTIPLKLAQYTSGDHFADIERGTRESDLPSQDQCSFLVRIILEVIKNANSKDDDLWSLTTKMDTKMMEICEAFNKNSMFETHPLPFLFREQNLTSPLFFEM